MPSRKNIASSIDIIIHLSRLRDKSRRIMEIAEVLDYTKGEMVLNPLFVFKEVGEDENKRVIGQLERTSNKMINTQKLRAAGIEY